MRSKKNWLKKDREFYLLVEFAKDISVIVPIIQVNLPTPAVGKTSMIQAENKTYQNFLQNQL